MNSILNKVKPRKEKSNHPYGPGMGVTLLRLTLQIALERYTMPFLLQEIVYHSKAGL